MSTVPGGRLVKRATLQTVAEAVGVSKMTVSNAYSRPDQLSAPLRARIFAAAKELGYAGPDLKARALTRGTTGAIGVVTSVPMRWAFTDVVLAEFLGAVAAELEKSGQALTLLGASAAIDAAARNVAVDGVLIFSLSAPAVAPLRERHIPAVYVDEVAPQGHSSVTVDDVGGAALATQHLVDLGHRRIAIVTPTFDSSSQILADATRLPATNSYAGGQRVIGWLRPLRAAAVKPVIAIAGPDDYDTIRNLLSRPDRPTGVVCYSDATANLVICAARDLGLDLPSDLSVVGFDDSSTALTVRPALTTVRQDVTAKGATAAIELRRVLDAHRAGVGFEPRHIVIPTSLVVRDSTAAPAVV